MPVRLLFLLSAFLLVACETVPDSAPEDNPWPDSRVVRIGEAQPVAVPPPPPVATRPPAPVAGPPEEPVVERTARFANLPGWVDADPAPALAAFRRSCAIWKGAEADTMLSPRLPQYGTFADWQPACAAAANATDARTFFETHFTPVELTTPTAVEGLLTGYYEPEIPVRRKASREFSEPVLAKPARDVDRLKPRADVDPTQTRVIAYGRPIDVFFMQIQGSGRLAFDDGLTIRAAFAGHNGQPYVSIGRKLVEWGELDMTKASKGAIEGWMERAGPMRARDLMNQNPRYIYFTEQSIPEGSGPNGAMRVPLTGMGSIALDPRYHPYGTLAFLSTRLPDRPRDYKGVPRSLLVVGQDTGGAIKGPLRADLFFGSGDMAGRLAGVQKHPVRWTLLLPRAIAPDPAAS